MAETDQEDRTEQGTARRREKAREEGRVVRSRELVSMAALGGILLVFVMAGSAFLRSMSGLTSRLLSLQYGRDSLAVMRSATVEMMLILAPFFLAAVVFAILASVVQGGFVIKPLSMKYEQLNPLNGLKNLFSPAAIPGFIKTLFKFILGVVVFYLVIKKTLLVLPMTAAMDLADIQTVTFGLTGKAVLYAFLTFFFVALADYLTEWLKFERSLKMTKEEIRQESRESDGDPLIKAKIKNLQREAARRRMMQAVPKATVVITNPTHIAVALQYNKDENAAPKIVAKGKGYIAEKIKELARQHGIPVVEDKPLARALVKGKLDSYIPADLYRAVAKILAYIYKLKGVA